MTFRQYEWKQSKDFGDKYAILQYIAVIQQSLNKIT